MDRNDNGNAVAVSDLDVALRKESVDRNSIFNLLDLSNVVALRKESVDRNTFLLPLVLILPKVALRKESVDRNMPSHWIMSRTGVALRKESVDRNMKGVEFSCL